jgi:hypothetical protein
LGQLAAKSVFLRVGRAKAQAKFFSVFSEANSLIGAEVNDDACTLNTNRQPKVHKKQQLMTPSLRFPLLAGGTE